MKFCAQKAGKPLICLLRRRDRKFYSLQGYTQDRLSQPQLGQARTQRSVLAPSCHGAARPSPCSTCWLSESTHTSCSTSFYPKFIRITQSALPQGGERLTPTLTVQPPRHSHDQDFEGSHLEEQGLGQAGGYGQP